jgi:PAS domain S-box-containing protein
MALFAESAGYRLAERLRRLRQKPLTAYGIALAAFAVATLTRWAIEDFVPGQVPFIFYFPALVIATFLGGLGPGIVVAILSGLTGASAFMGPQMSGEKLSALLAFALASLLLVALGTALNWALERLLAEVEQRRNGDLAKSRLAAIVESSEDAMITKDLNGTLTSWNAGAERLFGYTADEVIGKPVSILIPPERDDEEPAILRRIRSGKRVDTYDTMRRRKDGSLIDISLTVSPLRDATGKIVGASKVARDISERKRAAEQQELLIREMSHRVKNAFTVCQTLAVLSARSASTPEQMARDIGTRLTALARAHNFTRPGLLELEAKATEPMSLQKLTQMILAPYLKFDGSLDQERLIIKGPDISIGEKSVTGLALVLHELATNAAKYGALSSTTGKIHTDMSVVNGQLLINWEETGGPQLDGPPDNEGFGTFLTRQIVDRQFGGELSYDWKPEGLIVRLSLPADRVES